MRSVGSGAAEIRVRDSTGWFRVMYVAKFAEAVYVLHCFQKKAAQTPQPDIEIARKRYNALVQERIKARAKEGKPSKERKE